MPESIRPLPLFYAAFSALRRDNAIYVDKTAMVRELCQSRAKIFLARPRRFGKSLLTSTFESLFKYGLRDFKGLAIEDQWDDRTYTVVKLDFSLVKYFDSSDEFSRNFTSYIASQFRTAGYDGEPALQDWSLWLKKQPVNSIVLLIDEYDAPLTECLDRQDLFSAVQQTMSQFFLTVKAFEGCLRFFFMTGITKISNSSIFSDFNILRDISFVPKYGSLLGFTEDEIRGNFAPYISRAAEELGLSEESLLNRLRQRYFGYCFDKKASVRVCCPWDLLNFLYLPSDRIGPYWWLSGGSWFAVEKLLANHPMADFRSFAQAQYMQLGSPFEIQRGVGLRREELLFQAGYLTIKEVSENRVAALGYPNEEVAQCMATLYADKLLGGKCFELPEGVSISRVLADGTLDEAVSRFNLLFKAVVDDECTALSDASSCCACLRVLLMGAECISGVEFFAPQGCANIRLSAGSRRWIFEIKYARREAEVPNLLAEGAAQMNDRRYGEAPAGQGALELMHAVLVFSAEKRAFAAWAAA